MSYLKKNYKYRVFGILCVTILFFITQQAYAAIIVGNSKGSITLSFIYDYQCNHCHHMFPLVQKLITENRDLKVKLYPVAVINNNSLFEAATAIAATRIPGKFQELMTFLMYQPPLSTQQIINLLHKLDLDKRAFTTSIHSQWVKAQLMEGLQIMRQAHTKNIPIFIIKSRKISTTKILIGEQSYKFLENVLTGVNKNAKRN